MVREKPSEQVESRLKRFIDSGIPTRFKPGVSGNPGGSQKDPGITSSQIKMLDEPCPYDNHSPQKTWREWLAEKGLLLASNKEMALEHLKERLEGRVKYTVESIGEPLVTTMVFQFPDGVKMTASELKEGKGGQNSKGKDEALQGQKA